MKESGNSTHVDMQLSPGVRKLQIILEHLQNCRSFRINSFVRWASGLGDEECLCPSDAVGIIYGIIAETRLPVKSLHVDFRHGGSLKGARLPKQLHHQPDFNGAWANLEDLFLDFWPFSEGPRATSDWTRELILHSTGLRRLSLKIHYHTSDSLLNGLLSSPNTFQGLQELTLTSANFPTDKWLKLLLRSQCTFRKLSFWFGEFEPVYWKGFIAELRTFRLLEDVAFDFAKGHGRSKEKVVWHDFPALEANPAVPGSDGRKFKLRYKLFNRLTRVIGVSFDGRADMDKALDILSRAVQAVP